MGHAAQAERTKKGMSPVPQSRRAVPPQRRTHAPKTRGIAFPQCWLLISLIAPKKRRRYNHHPDASSPTAAEARAPLIEDDRSTYVSEVFGRNMDCVTKRATSSSRVSYCDLRRVQFKREVRFAVRSGQMGDVKATPIPAYLRRSF